MGWSMYITAIRKLRHAGRFVGPTVAYVVPAERKADCQYYESGIYMLNCTYMDSKPWFHHRD